MTNENKIVSVGDNLYEVQFDNGVKCSGVTLHKAVDLIEQHLYGSHKEQKSETSPDNFATACSSMGTGDSVR